MALSTTTFITLGLIAKHPGSGYDLARMADRSTAHFWHVPKSQLYAALSRLEKLGFIQGTTIRQEHFPDKRVYEATDAGLAALRAWLDDADLEPMRSKNATLLKVFFGAYLSPERLGTLLQEYRDDAEQRRERFAAIAARLDSQLTPERAFGVLTLRHGILQAEAALAWAVEAEQLLARVNATEPAP